MIFLCRNGHMHRQQWLADFCRRCKAIERRRRKRAEDRVRKALHDQPKQASA